MPRFVYRSGSASDANLILRLRKDTSGKPGQSPGLSIFETLERAASPGAKVQVIDVDLLWGPLRAFPDRVDLGGSEGHISIAPAHEAEEADLEMLVEWARSRGTEPPHPFTELINRAVIRNEAEMSIPGVKRDRELTVKAFAVDQVGENPDWDRIHEDVQRALERLGEKVSTPAPKSLSRYGRTTAPAFALFSYRVFYRADLDEDDPILVGVTIQEQGPSFHIAGDVSVEESGTIYYEEACEVSKDSLNFVKTVRDIADRLSMREADVLEALSQVPSPMQSDLESESSRSTDG